VSPAVQRWLSRGALLLLLALTVFARWYNHADIFHNDGRIYFVDGDCYSRMTRAKLVTEGHWVIKHQDFENWPQGTTPHTTAPMDWAIVVLKGACDVVLKVVDWNGTGPLRSQSLDVAGAIISPLLGLITAGWLWWWAGWMRLRYRGAMVFFFAASPMLVHGTVLGRPDHQSCRSCSSPWPSARNWRSRTCALPRASPGAGPSPPALRGGSRCGCRCMSRSSFFAGAVVWHLVANRAALFAKATRARWFALGG
jgi:hypothetical protein